MAVRNFWIEANIDGRKTRLTGGPRAKDGGFSLTVYQRDKGGISVGMRVSGYVKASGRLVIHATDGLKTLTNITDR